MKPPESCVRPREGRGPTCGNKRQDDHVEDGRQSERFCQAFPQPLNREASFGSGPARSLTTSAHDAAG